MTIDEAKRKIVFQTTLTLPGYAQLLPKARLHYDYTIEQILKELLNSDHADLLKQLKIAGADMVMKAKDLD